MAGRRRGAPRGAARGVALRAEAARTRAARTSTRTTRSQAGASDVPQVYREMLAEAGVNPNRVTTSDAPERPLKKPRTGRRPVDVAAPEAETVAAAAAVALEAGAHRHEPAESSKSQQASVQTVVSEPEEEDEDVEFEDVEIPKPTLQTTYLSSADESEEDEEEEEEEDIHFEDVDIDAIASRQEPADKGTDTLQLNLTAAQEALTPSKRNRKQPLTKEEKERRVHIHQMHVLCLLAHVEKRNHWCNDPFVQESLRPLLRAKTVQYLNPASSLTQFGQTESLKRGLKEAQEVFQERFRITEVGLRRALWAEDPTDLQDYELPRNIDSCLDKVEFRKAARNLRGSRDVGAQLFCALLRAVGVETRLVCSLQPLSFVPGGPSLPKSSRQNRMPSRPPPASARADPVLASPSPARPSPRARLGHPNATAYRIPDIATPSSSSDQRPPRPNVRINESFYPIYWAEILDVGHQKWQPVDALVTGQHFRPHRLEPPAADRTNVLTYAVAFEDDGTAKDVTRRYAKAMNSKTRRMRIDGPSVPSSVDGAKWWRKALRRYKPRGPPSDLDQIENIELSTAEEREPMPRNVADFKDHPIYALERHLRRHEVLVPGAQVVGTVGAGSKGPLEKIYRRKDVRVAKSVDKWYRLGRVIKPGEDYMKVLPKRKAPKRKGRWHLNEAPEQSSDDDDPVLGLDPAKGNPIYTFEQTELYTAPPVVAGRIPKNKFGNIDVYVPFMVPPGGIHVKHARAGHAAHLLGVDYAPALQGFEFKGRKGTAVYNGVVIPVEAAEGVRAVLKGFDDLESQLQEERRSLRALETWRKWLRTLRIRRRIFEGDEYWGDTELGEFDIPSESEDDDDDDDDGDDEPRGYGLVGGMVLDDDEDGGGGFEPGGFEPEPGGFEPGPGGFGQTDPRSGTFATGGFEPSELEPGGFELEESQPGGFEIEAGGKGKDVEPPILSHLSGDKTVEITSEKSNGEDENSAQDAGGFIVEADVDMADRSPPTVERSHTASVAAAVKEGDLALSGAVPVGEPIPDAQLQAGEKKVLVDGSLLAEQRLAEEEEEGSEDVELEDAPSDVTEELFMDDDGSLVE